MCQYKYSVQVLRTSTAEMESSIACSLAFLFVSFFLLMIIYGAFSFFKFTTLAVVEFVLLSFICTLSELH